MAKKIKPEQLIEEAVSKSTKYGDILDRDEMVSEAWIIWWEELESSPYSYSQCLNILIRKLKTINRDERSTYMYFTGNFVYTPAMVRAFLDNVVWDELSECADIDARLDLQGAIDKLPPKQQESLFKRYGLKDEGLSESQNRNVSRAIETLTTKLNEQYNKVVPAENIMEGMNW